jgi:hypothetical protein
MRGDRVKGVKDLNLAKSQYRIITCSLKQIDKFKFPASGIKIYFLLTE